MEFGIFLAGYVPGPGAHAGDCPGRRPAATYLAWLPGAR